MDFFEKLQESIYDIVGYLIPGLIIVIALMPSFALYRDNGTLVFPVQALYNKSNLSSIKFLEDMNFSTSKGILILFIAYLAGHLVKYLANLYYKVVKSIEKKIFKRDVINWDQYASVIKKAEEIYKKNFYKDDPNSYTYDEDLLVGYGRVQTRMYKVSSLVQKYISKYNFYCSISFIFFLFILNCLIIFIYKYTFLFLIFILILIFICLVQKFIQYSLDDSNSVWISFVDQYWIWHYLSWIILVPMIYIISFDKTMLNYLGWYFILILLYKTFNCEYRRHYKLHIKEALYGLIYVNDNEETKYSIKYNKKL